MTEFHDSFFILTTEIHRFNDRNQQISSFLILTTEIHRFNDRKKQQENHNEDYLYISMENTLRMQVLYTKQYLKNIM